MNLREMQLDFAEAIKNKDKENKILSCISSHKKLSPSENLAIYSNSVIGNFIQCLIETYNVCYQLVGETFFNATSEVYIQQYPSFSPDLNQYGAFFSGFLKQFTPAQQLPYLADVAELEWALHQAWIGADATRLDFNSLDFFRNHVFWLISALNVFLRCSFTSSKLRSSKDICLELNAKYWVSKEVY